jgi:hypothetical protein
MKWGSQRTIHHTQKPLKSYLTKEDLLLKNKDWDITIFSYVLIIFKVL